MTKIFSALDSIELTKLHAKAKCVCTLEISQNISQNSGFMRLFTTIWNFSYCICWPMSLCIFKARFWGFFSVMETAVVAVTFVLVMTAKKVKMYPNEMGIRF